MLEFLSVVAVTAVGFAAGYGVRELISRRRTFALRGASRQSRRMRRSLPQMTTFPPAAGIGRPVCRRPLTPARPMNSTARSATCSANSAVAPPTRHPPPAAAAGSESECRQPAVT